ncbi:hypothetical protein RM844_18695 [Streptomyces sp. DSM 44915]|uniref:Uncharacterized protein n=1 Tax=Streptomyces chisholmiae TaxID=3075540 RepID=A0ABU2JU94_9ACTN|nr:hypothetical protein [Streptomyces sp. DSM 44915]MDT0268314.1 hypothetical protein [Streptomyces sp. DSM 44915]
MNAPKLNVGLLAAVRGGHPAPAPVLRPRVASSAALPTVPVPGGELTGRQVAAVLFEAGVEELYQPRLAILLAALADTYGRVNPGELAQATEGFMGLDVEEFPEVAVCWQAAYRLCLAFWYHRAVARPMTAGEVAACLYLAGAEPTRRATTTGTTMPAPILGAATVARTAHTLPTRLLIGLGRAFADEFAPDPWFDGSGPGSADSSESGPAAGSGLGSGSGSGQGSAGGSGDSTWLYRQLMPQTDRRARCFTIGADSARWRLPLIVRPENGPLTLGATAPEALMPERMIREGW